MPTIDDGDLEMMMTNAPSDSSSAPHPLDPLNAAEIEIARAAVRARSDAGAHLRFVNIELDEPHKDVVMAWRLGQPAPRAAFLTLLRRDTGAAFEARVDLTSGTIADWRELAVDQSPFGQPAVMVEEFQAVERAVKNDPAWRAAVARRGLSEAEIDLVQVDPFSAGHFGYDAEKGRRCVRAVSYYRETLHDNGYSHPIEGLVAVVDLNREEIVTLIDEEKIVPIPRTKHNYEPHDLPPPRTDLKPLHITQPDGPSFGVDGWTVDWQKWSFRIGFTPREGVVLHQLGYADDGRIRPIIYRASVTEMVVPYADPTANHYWKSAFDAGEYGLGRLANALELGCDCLGHIHYFDVPTLDDLGQPMVMKNAICMHEEDYGILWKHHEIRTRVHETRRSRRLVISFFATVGNYDYGFYWYLYQDGTIQLEAKLTGIIQTAAVAPGETYAWGGMVGEGLGGPTHQHFFNVRMHMMVDGDEGNSVSEHEFHPRPWGQDNPHGNVFDLVSRPLARERDAAREADGRTGRYWKISNPNRRNAVGGHPAYKLMVQPTPLMLAQPESYVHARGGFAAKHVWVTPYDPAERYASGDYPNQHAGGDGLPRYIQANRNIDNQDLVLWHSFGHTHVCKPEDFPVMPVEYAGFMLKPNGFFSQNAGIDVPADRDPGSVQHDDGGTCCAGKD